MKLVFFGDSITESGRNLQDATDLGNGYVSLAAAKLRPLYAETEFEIRNYGVGGEKTADLLARVSEVVAEKPDVVVLQVGVNDVWCRFSHGEIVTEEQFSHNYGGIVAALKASGAKVILIEPFVLNIGDKRRFRTYLDPFIGIVRSVAQKEGCPLICLDEIFRGVTQDIDPTAFSTDGVHPTHRACRYIADLVIKELKKCL